MTLNIRYQVSNIKLRQAGFTLIELIIAAAIFGLLLLVITSGIVQIMRIYQSGIASRRTQAVTRVALETLTRDIRSSTNAVVNPGLPGQICLEGGVAVRYQRTAGNSLLRQPINGGCIGGTPNGTATTIINGAANTQLRRFENVIIRNPAGNPASVATTLLVTTGTPDLFDPSGSNTCLPGSGSQFCSSTQFSTAVTLRGAN